MNAEGGVYVWCSFLVAQRGLTLRQRHSIVHEVQVMEACDHPGIVGLAAAFENDEEVILVLELCVPLLIGRSSRFTAPPPPGAPFHIPLSPLDVFSRALALRVSLSPLITACRMEGGDLFDALITKKKFTEEEARQVTQALLTALEYLHARGIVHRGTQGIAWSLHHQRSDVL